MPGSQPPTEYSSPLGKHLDSSHKDIAVPVCFQDLKSGTDKRWRSIVNTDSYTNPLGFMRLAKRWYFFTFFCSCVTQHSIQNVVRTAVSLPFGADCHFSPSQFRCTRQPSLPRNFWGVSHVSLLMSFEMLEGVQDSFPWAFHVPHKQSYYLTDCLLKLGVTQAHTNLWPTIKH